MKRTEFYLGVVHKTILNHTDMKYNLAHMALGVASELTAEFLEAVENNDYTNLKEELGDAEWFVLGWAKFEGLIVTDSEIIVNDELSEKTAENVYKDLLKNVGKLCTVVKNTIIKDKPKLDGVILDAFGKQELLDNLLLSIQLVADSYFVNMNEVRESIAKKLNVRYNGGGFSAEKSLDRDLKAERTVLESSNKNQLELDLR